MYLVLLVTFGIALCFFVDSHHGKNAFLSRVGYGIYVVTSVIQGLEKQKCFHFSNFFVALSYVYLVFEAIYATR